jgi:hypothetical protein
MRSRSDLPRGKHFGPSVGLLIIGLGPIISMNAAVREGVFALITVVNTSTRPLMVKDGNA